MRTKLPCRPFSPSNNEALCHAAKKHGTGLLNRGNIGPGVRFLAEKQFRRHRAFLQAAGLIRLISRRPGAAGIVAVQPGFFGPGGHNTVAGHRPGADAFAAVSEAKAEAQPTVSSGALFHCIYHIISFVLFDMLTKAGMIQSMSKVAKCIDNGPHRHMMLVNIRRVRGEVFGCPDKR